ncbi:hypothetical protein COMNV_00235 [Commensalibacter sp. Nvir]|uniref:hypothetical protein n=1 Tax=Commensalibacter sp. Nvir TaxID=3069817 RepID=UPI002D52DA87|nr:hypothetical protein COMNV_00235 [Commensalibacter sp. Nvir]
MSLEIFLKRSIIKENIPEEIKHFVQYIIANKNVLAVLYYGSSLRHKNLSGILDFYVVCNSVFEWHQAHTIKAIANYWLPPNVEYYEYNYKNTLLRAKVAILSLKQFHRATRINSLDTTVWARFCQPIEIVWIKNSTVEQAILALLVRASKVASFWSAILGPQKAHPEKFWIELFKQTYRTELRVESSNRPELIVQTSKSYFSTLLKWCWLNLPVPFTEDSSHNFLVNIDYATRKKYYKRWLIRHRLGKPLNTLRLIKAAFTFKNGAQYIVWKINRHKEMNLTLTPFQSRHPLFCALWIAIKLYRNKIFSN